MTDLVQLAIPAFILLMVAEAVFDAVMRRDLYEVKDTAASLTMGMGNVLAGLLSQRHGLRHLHLGAPVRDLSHRVPMVGVGAGVFCRRFQLLLVSSDQPRMSLLLGVTRRTPLIAAI